MKAGFPSAIRRSLAAAAAVLVVLATAHGQEATERFIPIGQSPGLSSIYTDIAEITKVNPTYLKCIEDEEWDDLPALVYMRGFLTAYTRAVGLDTEKVLATYMPRLESQRQGKGRGRLLGRR